MARLEVRIMGPFEASLDGERVSGFDTDSTKALLAYLASEPGRRWSRPIVAEMLWPERPQGAALSNLRHALSVLRRVLGDSDAEQRFVIADRNTVSIADDVWVDVVEFRHLVAADADPGVGVEPEEQAIELWRGPLLEGLRVKAGAEWQEWLVVTEERLRREMAGVLRQVADYHERGGAWESAISVARRLTEVDPWDERPHRQLMRLLALKGETARALSHCVQLEEKFRQELGADLTAETASLVERIRAGDLPGTVTHVEIAYPGFLGKPASSRGALFVGRDLELRRLQSHLDVALTGRGRVVLVAGEAGSGKTTLANEFMQRSIEVPGLLVARGRCSAFGGLGDPYLPFREVLSLLCGDVEAAYTSGALDGEQATRLWEAIPHAAQLVADVGPSLIGVMVNGRLLLERLDQALGGARLGAGVGTRLESLVERYSTGERPQPVLFDEYLAVLERLAITRPLVLVIDDLQWADSGSIALLWHLARRLDGLRVLIVGAFRPEDIDHLQGAGLSLASVLGEVQAGTPESVIELGSDRGFVDEFLDSEPNALDEEFRQRLYSYTGGHALFTVELVRGMQERGELRRDRAGVWMVGADHDSARLPSRIEAVVAQRVARLPQPLQRDLAVAAIQGEEFVAEVVADVRGDPLAVGRLSSETGTPHRLIEPAGAARIGEQLTARHRFRHGLFQSYLYERMERADRARLHEETGRAIEKLYRDQAEPPIIELARHFDLAGLVDPAARYLLRAGQRAVQMSAAEEAIRLLERARSLLADSAGLTDRDELELALLSSLFAALMSVRGYGAPEAEEIGSRVEELCAHLEPSPTTAFALLGLASFLSVRSRYKEAVGVCRNAEKINDVLGIPALTVLNQQLLGYQQTWMGDLEAGHQSLQYALEVYDPQEHAWLIGAFGSAGGTDAAIWDSVNTLHRGYPEQAISLGSQGIAVAEQLGHPFVLAVATAIGGIVLRLFMGDYCAAGGMIDEVERIAVTEHFPFYEAAAMVYRGVAVGYLGDPEAGAGLVRSGLAAWEAMGIKAFLGGLQAYAAHFEAMVGNFSQAVRSIDESLAETQASGEGLSEIVCRVTRGQILSLCSQDDAIDALAEAKHEAQLIGARLLELQAATHLAELHRRRGDIGEAKKTLAPTYAWFTEGFDTTHLRAAREVLANL